MEYIIWCDESERTGELYSNFYGGALVESTHVQYIIDRLNKKKEELNLFSEIKWIKITEAYQQKYIDILDDFFSLIEQGHIKIRIMFTDNARVPVGITKEQKENEYFLLYYQFIKHAFGLLRVSHEFGTKLHINFDKIPDSKAKSDDFKGHIFGLNYFFNKSGVFLSRDSISEVDSKSHVVLQCLDIILGSMAFKLNKKHLAKAPDSMRRGKKTRAKEAVYKFINSKIQSLYKNYKFNIGISTGMRIPPYVMETAPWEMPYRHWVFESKNSVYDETKKIRKAQ